MKAMKNLTGKELSTTLCHVVSRRDGLKTATLRRNLRKRENRLREELDRRFQQEGFLAFL